MVSERERLQAACDTWPEVSTSVQQLEAHLRSADIDTSRLSDERLSDLYLVCACAEGNASAIAAFDERHTPQIRRVAVQFFAGPNADDFVQQALAHLLVPRQDRPPRVAAYAGSGSLGAFVRMVTSRLAIDRQRVASPAPADLPRSLEDLLTDRVDAFDVVAAAEARTQLTEALGRALRNLAPIERRALRMRFVLQFSLARTGKALGVHELSVSRMVARARSRVLAELTASSVLPDSPAVLANLARSLDLSISRLLESNPDLGRLDEA